MGFPCSDLLILVANPPYRCLNARARNNASTLLEFETGHILGKQLIFGKEHATEHRIGKHKNIEVINCSALGNMIYHVCSLVNCKDDCQQAYNTLYF